MEKAHKVRDKMLIPGNKYSCACCEKEYMAVDLCIQCHGLALDCPESEEEIMRLRANR